MLEALVEVQDLFNEAQRQVDRCTANVGDLIKVSASERERAVELGKVLSAREIEIREVLIGLLCAVRPFFRRIRRTPICPKKSEDWRSRGVDQRKKNLRSLNCLPLELNT